MPLRVSKNHFVQYFLSVLRDRRTKPEVFREYLKKLGFALALEAHDVVNRERVQVETPIDVAEGLMPGEKVSVVAILRAGLPMALGVIEAFDWASLGLIAAKRIEEGEIRAEVYYENVPESDLMIVVDPMIATGSTLVETIRRIQNKAKRIIVIAAIAAPEGVKRLLEEFPEVYLIVASVDKGLNSQAFIVPGLGDAGDRAFGTERFFQKPQQVM